MKKLFTLVTIALAILTANTAEAQVKFGLKGGLNVTNMSFSSSVVESNNRAGFFIGPTLLVQLPVVGLGVDVSALYDQREAKLENSESSVKVQSKTVKQQAINIPINLRYGVGLGDLASIYAAAGPQFGFNVGDDNQTLFGNAAEWKLKKSNFSVNLGAGVMLLSHLQIGFNYNVVCGKTGEVTVLGGTKSVIRGRANSWQVSAAYYF